MKRLETTGLEIAVVGMAGRFPGAKNIDEFWHNIAEGKESISYFSKEEVLASGINEALVENADYIRARGILGNIDKFDASFFGYSPKEAAVMDPQQRLFLQTAWQSLENAGYNSKYFPGHIGVYASVGFNSYLVLNLEARPDFMNAEHGPQAMLGNDKDFLATRVSYKLNLTGPAVMVQSACSSSLVAIHQACQSLISGEADMQIAGGVTVRVPETSGNLYQEGMIISPDGHCRPFDKEAMGTVAGNGVGVVVLKRLEDAIADRDYIYGVIKASAINNDGNEKVGYTAPSSNGQAKAIASAISMAEVDPATIGYIETHGSGTSMGDPIELEALDQVYSSHTDKVATCALGGVKANIGHLDAAAGVAGFIKGVLCVHHGIIPPMVNFNESNPLCDFETSAFYVPTHAKTWQTGGLSRRAGISSFGMGGTNAHIIVEQAPDRRSSGHSRKWQLVNLSAKTASALDRQKDSLRNDLAACKDDDLADLAYTLKVGRHQFTHNFFTLTSDIENAKTNMHAGHSTHCYNDVWDGNSRPITFMFSGQGSQYLNMGRDLYRQEASFRDDIDECDRILLPVLNRNLSEFIFVDDTSEEEIEAAKTWLNNTEITQPALFVIEYAMARLMMRWGVQPESFIGHSIGEYVAACLAGVFSLEQALRLVASRGKLIQGLPEGDMLFVASSVDTLKEIIGSDIDIALINAPESTVLSGTTEAISDLASTLDELGVKSKTVRTSHAFHSRMMDDAVDAFKDLFTSVDLQAPKIPVVSNLTGDWLTEEQATSPEYWAQHLRNTVMFAPGIETLTKGPYRIFLEVGPGTSLVQFAKQTLKQKEHICIASMAKANEELDAQYCALRTVGLLWQHGVEINWDSFYEHETRNRLPLASYPFKGESYWVKMDNQHKRRSTTPYYLQTWQQKNWLEGFQNEKVDILINDQDGDVRLGDSTSLSQVLVSCYDTQEIVTIQIAYPQVGAHEGIRDSLPRLTAFEKSVNTLAEHISQTTVKTRIILTTVNAYDLENCRPNAWDTHFAYRLLNSITYIAPHLSVVQIDIAGEENFALGREDFTLPKAIWECPSNIYMKSKKQWWNRCFTNIETQPHSEIQAHELAVIGGNGQHGIALITSFLQSQDSSHEVAVSWICETELTEDIKEQCSSLGVVMIPWDGSAEVLEDKLASFTHNVGIVNLLSYETKGKRSIYDVGEREEFGSETITDEFIIRIAATHGRSCLFNIWFLDQDVCASFPDSIAGFSHYAIIESNDAVTTIMLDTNKFSELDNKCWQAVLSSYENNIAQIYLGECAPEELVWEETMDGVEDHEDRYQRPDLPTPYAAPLTRRQKEIAAIWQEMFQINKVGIHDNFFDLGGDSVMALKLLSELEARFRVSLPLAEVINSPCIADQANSVAEYLTLGLDERPPQPLVKLQTQGSKPPIFCVHPAGGIIHCYIEMSRILGKDQPFYAFQHPGIDGKIGAYSSYEKMAELYIESMKEIQPEGPYYIAGWSFGGTLAYEMGVQLKAKGEEIAMLSMFDSPGPTSLYRLNQRPEFEFAGMLSFLSQALGAMFEVEITVDVEEMRKVAPEAQLDFVLQKLIDTTGESDLGNAREALERIVDLFELCDRGEREYEPMELDFPIHMYRVQELADYEFTGYKNHPHLESATFGWDQLCKQKMEVRFIPGTHMTMVFPPFVQSLTEKFAEDLAKCVAFQQQKKAA